MIVIDVGNTNIVIGFYTKNKLNKIIRLKTEKKIFITQKELNKFFKSNKIETSRILFAKRLDSYQEHISRYSLADLFLS